MAEDPHTPPLPTDVGAQSIEQVYGQYYDYYNPDPLDGPPSTVTQNNLPSFLAFFLSGGFSPQDIVNQAYGRLVRGYKLAEININDNSRITTEILDNIGLLINQPRPLTNPPCFMTWKYDNPPFDTTVAGTPWGGWVSPSDPNTVPNCPWYFSTDPMGSGPPVSNATYFRCLEAQAYKLFGRDSILPGAPRRYYRVPSLISTIFSIYILLRTPDRAAANFIPTDIKISKSTTGTLVWDITEITGITATEDDRAVLNWVNPDGSFIWQKMAGVRINFPDAFKQQEDE